MTDPIDLIEQAFKQPTARKIRESICDLLDSKEINYSDLGYFIAQNADGLWIHPHLSLGIAFIAVGEEIAFVVEWNDDNIVNFYETTVSEAENAIWAKENELNSDTENCNIQQPSCCGN